MTYQPFYLIEDELEQTIPLLTPDEERKMHAASLPDSWANASAAPKEASYAFAP